MPPAVRARTAGEARQVVNASMPGRQRGLMGPQEMATRSGIGALQDSDIGQSDPEQAPRNDAAGVFQIARAVELGGVVAVPALRGGGEFGRAW